MANPTQRNMEVLMAERANLAFHNKVIDGTAIKRLRKHPREGPEIIKDGMGMEAFQPNILRIPLFFTTQGFETFQNREISTGASAIREQLADLDLRIIIDYSLVEWKELGEESPTGNEWEDQKVGRRRDFLVRRMELAKNFIRTNIEPEWMVLCLLPVLPPELRPIIQIDGGKLMSSDINELYRRVIYRNNTLIDLLTTSRSTPGELVMCQEKLVQEAVDTLLDNGIRGQPMRDGHNKAYKSFSDVIEGKEGRFRETLLSKRVDYSGRKRLLKDLLSLGQRETKKERCS
ncbi:DNA-directed RNA polymerase subunit beta'-like [Ziziphus jujuba]|uniref:DNA-directed RNA polymerase subunit n=1 Tax=Ziziphus jujuba TaxID=326968 RepID=A0ABM4A7Q7_ZIZJJ|nr:DNA-directed RNA polymerase subunit beta'-like [Ziziphus jujuba]